MQWCAYYGDVCALKLLLSKGETLQAFGEDMGLSAAAFHGHWRLCQFLVESGANVNCREEQTAEVSFWKSLAPDNRCQLNLFDGQTLPRNG